MYRSYGLRAHLPKPRDISYPVIINQRHYRTTQSRRSTLRTALVVIVKNTRTPVQLTDDFRSPTNFIGQSPYESPPPLGNQYSVNRFRSHFLFLFSTTPALPLLFSAHPISNHRRTFVNFPWCSCHFAPPPPIRGNCIAFMNK